MEVVESRQIGFYGLWLYALIGEKCSKEADGGFRQGEGRKFVYPTEL